ncbi:two-component system, chemotaxis family, sensor kinase CheA [Desulfacinum hydrothermale DSM 13146]|uniref:histidine kinase n=1 Tax=Desulfacinum hydrothermale DSM 13146 TaxID=1121390 RepID=A0A1W1X9Y6_9BACT|nr:response regulator [Desulfacinum hydrothermale]SMC20815.1 two-component system, chemotaxis family, sensor kinase CheA [Desulfacinum hydrothermale DSM 13146]
MNEEELLRRLRQAFQVEARERMDSLAAKLADMERGLEGEEADQALEVAYREMHSLKGASRAVGLADIEAVCQSAEGLLAALKRKEIQPVAPVIDALYQALSAVEDRLEGREEAGPDTSTVCRRLEDALKAAKKTTEAPPPEKTPTTEASGRPEGSPAPSAEPDPISSEPASVAVSPSKRAEGAPDAPRREARTVRVDVDRLDLFLHRAEEFISTRLEMERHLRDLKRLLGRLEHMNKRCSFATKELRWLREAAEAAGGESDGSTPSEVRDLLEFVETSRQSLLEAYSQARNVLQHAEGMHHRMGQLVDDLMEGAKEVLLQPVSILFSGLSRMVHELSRHLGKEARLETEGEDVELDRRILEELKDPLVHLIRNAVDHGLEEPAARQAAGKNPVGVVRLRVVRRDAGTAILYVEDDGRGVPLDQVKGQAVTRGFLSRAEADALSDEEALQLIFRSDLSTSPLVTDLSGRGLGMAIVKDKVDNLGGKIRVTSEAGRGTRFELQLPISLATFRGVLVEEAGRFFILPTLCVEAVVRPGKEDVRRAEGTWTISHQGAVVPLHRLADVLGLGPSGNGSDSQEGCSNVVIVQAGGKRRALQVDAILGESEMVLKPLGTYLGRVHNLWGATVLGDGRVVPVLNPLDLVRQPESRGSVDARKDAAGGDTGRQWNVLVAEDSVTSRTLLQNILTAAGYRVKTAVDGMDAYTQLCEEPFDLVVSDVEMPRLDGFELTAKIRANDKLKDIPIVLVTSLDSREDRERGMEVGADAYIVKGSFDQSHLLEVMDRLL